MVRHTEEPGVDAIVAVAMAKAQGPTSSRLTAILVGLGQSRRWPVDRRPPAVHQERRAGDVARGVGSKEGHRRRYFAWLRPSIEYGVRCQSPPYLRPHLQRSDERRLHDTRHNGIDPYPEWTNFRGEAAHHLDNAGFRCAINGQAGLERRRANR